jgi:hypothetical protein
MQNQPHHGTEVVLRRGYKKMPDVDLANRHPALQSMCSKD